MSGEENDSTAPVRMAPLSLWRAALIVATFAVLSYFAYERVQEGQIVRPIVGMLTLPVFMFLVARDPARYRYFLAVIGLLVVCLT